MSSEAIARLGNDADYYGSYGKQFLSNSDIKTLLENPAEFGKSSPKTVDMVKGSYFHAKALEPDKVKNFLICDASTRNTNKYKELAEAHGDIVLLSQEVEELDAMVSSIKAKIDLFDMIYDDANTYEVPAIAQILGETWKGKADIVTPELVIDLKTTSKLDDFKFSARKYNYDSQAYIYNQLFGKPVLFIAVEKGTNKTGVFDCSEEFLDRGREKVIRAIEVWRKFFGPNKTEDVDQFYLKDQL
jgi:hypothetical protein